MKHRERRQNRERVLRPLVDAVSEETSGSKTTTFTSFAEEFSKITQSYSDTIREHYAKEHEENLTYDDPYLG